ncbi:MAG: hypothetical protein ACYDAC_00135 [Candidatus Dormibacteria bacterium]
MSQPTWRPVDGDEITPSRAAPGDATDMHAAEISAAEPRAEAVATAPQPRPARAAALDWRSLAIAGILVLVLLQLVVGILAFGSINQLRDQTTAANGLQRCLINAQLGYQSSSNTTAYSAAVKACLSK